MMPPEKHILRGLFELAQRDPQRVLFTFVDENGKDAEHRTAAELVQNIRRLAAYLHEGCGLAPGDTALLIYPPSIEFIEAYGACLLAGIVAAPVYPPNLARPQNDLVRLNAVAASSGARAMLTNRAYRWASRMSSAKERLSGENARWPALPWYVTQGLGWFGAKRKLHIHDNVDSEVAILQFTSGSTSVPKGVRLTHRNLIHQLDLNADILRIEPDSRMVMWVPQYHDLGLISGITAIFRGRGQLWFTSPLSFLKRPALWFDLMHRVRATHTASPNFGYELAVRKTTAAQREKWDLSSLQVFMNAAEPIVPQTMDNFITQFAASGVPASAFCPAYGLAEHAVGVTLGGRKRIRLDRHTLVSKRIARLETAGDLELIGCGAARCGVAVRLVAPEVATEAAATAAPLPERHIGEIWVQSDSVADGYQGLAELSEATFRATLAGEPGHWLRTGDLGFMHEGELFITGRQKDLIIIRGRNLHPEDIEESVRNIHPGIRAGGVVAFSTPGHATEELVIMLEVTQTDTAQLEQILQAVKRRVGEVWQMQTLVALVASHSLKKTTSGKIQRAANRQAWLEQTFTLLKADTALLAPAVDRVGSGVMDSAMNHAIASAIAQAHAAIDANTKSINWHNLALEDRVDTMLALIRQLAHSKLAGDVAHIGPDDFLPDVGLDSLSGSELLALLDVRLQLSLPNTLFIEHPTLRSAAQRILQEMKIEFLGASIRVEHEAPLPFRPPHRAMAPGATRIGIVGGGVGGLITALELARTGYRDITIFEADDEVGGKVLTQQIGNEQIELGQNFFGDSFRHVLDLAHELGCELAPNEQAFKVWEEQYGFEDAPVRRATRAWSEALLKAARRSMNPAQPFPCLFEDVDLPFSAYLQKYRLRQPSTLYFFDWNALGYGMDMDISAAYVLSYLGVSAHSGNAAYVVNGNRSLWTTLAQHLSSQWGVKILRQHRVESVTNVAGNDAQVEIRVAGQAQSYPFEEVVLALPPKQLSGILQADDPLQPFLDKFSHLGYVVHGFRAEGLFDNGILFMPEHASQLGKPCLIQACHQHTGWYISGQYSADHAPTIESLPAQQLEQNVVDLVEKLGGRVLEFGPQKNWEYFPHLRQNAAKTLQQIEALQGQRHIWATGAWLSFETTEHVARHARHLVRTCFDPAYEAPQPEQY
jgi:acyl-CoA synthetase (AMP-forming)/AMP-acid ligase II